ncbi:MAG TPA: hypothetical protein DEV93_10520 [Chloroflexi bacterium]|nr:hypothetical protein [Chloroflexota bacterium]
MSGFKDRRQVTTALLDRQAAATMPKGTAKADAVMAIHAANHPDTRALRATSLETLVPSHSDLPKSPRSTPPTSLPKPLTGSEQESEDRLGSPA